MTIHHIINDYNLSQGGAQYIALNLHQEGLSSGISWRLLGLSKNPSYKIEHAYSLDYSSPYKFIVFYKVWQYLRKEVHHGDIIHVHLFPSSLFVSLLKHLKLIPKCTLILTEHSASNRRRNSFFGKILDSITYNSYDTIVAISQGVFNNLKRYKPQLSNKLIVINNGINLFYKQSISRVQKKEIIILSVGRLHELKNYKVALNAIAKIADLNITYWIAGEGKLKKQLNQQVNLLGLQKKVKFLGYVPDIPSLLKKADIFFMPSLSEGFGLAAVEAMNASLPCVASNIEGLKDVFSKDGEDVFLVSPNDEMKMAQKLTQLINDRTLRNNMGEKAFRRSMNFGLREMANNYIHLYNSFK